jgi:hypothetical protein
MSVKGHPHARFRRALRTGNVLIAETAARDLGRLTLEDALDLCLLYRSQPERYERAVARWIARLIAERPGLRLSELEVVAAGFRDAVHDPGGEAVVRAVLARRPAERSGRRSE